MRLLLIPAFSALALLLSACANPGVPQSSALNYSVQSAQRMQEVHYGTVVAVQPVLIAPDSTNLGTATGALAGGYLGSRIGQGNGSTAAAIAGAIAGGIAGSAIEGAATRQQGLQITVRLDDGRIVAITQAADVQLSTGQRVQVIGSLYGGKARVLPAQ